MTAIKTLIVFPASLHGRRWATGPRVKPELVSMFTALRRNGFEVDVLDLENEVGNPGAIDREAFHTNAEVMLRDRAAGLVVVACSSSLQYTASIAVAEIVRRLHPGAVVAVAGFHVSVRPGDFTYQGAPFNWVVTGDPEMTLVQAAQAAASGGHPVARQECEGATFELTEQNAPDFAAYPYVASGLPTLPVYLSRGCPYPRAACQLRPGGSGWRAYSPDVAVGIIGQLSDLKPRRIEVLDPSFGLESGWRSAVLERLAGDEARRSVPVYINARPESFTRADVDKAYAARLHVRLDVDTLSVTLLARTGAAAHPQAHVAKTLDLIAYANAKGLPGELRLVFNQPGETRQTATETLDRVAELVAAWPNASLRLAASSWAYYPYADYHADVEVPRERFGTRLMHDEWWREGVPSERAAKAVVASTELADLEPGSDSYWQPRFEPFQQALSAKLTAEARLGLRSHESVGSAAADVPHGFWAEPRWH